MNNSEKSKLCIQIEKSKVLKIERINQENITLDTLYTHRKLVAEIIVKYGDCYLPIFIRIENEIREREENSSYRKLALQIGSNTSL